MGRASCCNCLRCTMGRASSNCLNFDFTKKTTSFLTWTTGSRNLTNDQLMFWTDTYLYIFLLWQNKASIIIELNLNDESYFTNWISSFTKSLIKIFFLLLVTEKIFLNVPVFFIRYTVIHIPHWCTVKNDYNFCMMNFFYIILHFTFMLDLVMYWYLYNSIWKNKVHLMYLPIHIVTFCRKY